MKNNYAYPFNAQQLILWMSRDMEWQDINTAPKDGRPVWVTGWDFGAEDGSRHYCWAYYHGGEWLEPNSAGASELTHLTHWMKL